MLIATLILGLIAGFAIFNLVDILILYTHIRRFTVMMKQIVLFNILLIIAIIALWIYNYMNFK